MAVIQLVTPNDVYMKEVLQVSEEVRRLLRLGVRTGVRVKLRFISGAN